MSEALAEVDVEANAPASARRLEEESFRTIVEYCQSLSTTHGGVRIVLSRQKPATWGPNNTPIKGMIDTFEEPISEEEIRNSYGGGTYQLKIFRPNKQGTYVYATARTVSIAGDPKIPGHQEQADQPRQPTEQASVATEAVRAMQRTLERTQSMAESRTTDPGMQALIASLQSQVQTMQSQNQAQTDRLLALASQKPERGSTDVLLERMVTSESSRIESLRVQHESEMRMIREGHRQEIERIYAQSDDALKRQDRAATSQLESVRAAFDGRLHALEIAHSGVVEGLKRELQSGTDSLKRELQFMALQLNESKTECGALRAKKDKTLLENVTEMAALREALDTLKGDDNTPEAEEKSKLERVLEKFSPLVEGIATRIAEPPQPPQAAQAAVPQIIQLPDGRIAARQADGTMVEVRRKKKVKNTAGVEMPELDPEVVKMAIVFLENAQRADRDPAEFVASARTMIPGEVTHVIREIGVDRFLSEIAKVPQGSPLQATAGGRNWIREVGRILVEGG